VALAALTVIVTGPVVVAVGLLESVAFTVTVTGPAVVGVPLIVQFVSISPVGSVPATIWQAYGAVPPLTPMFPLYGTLTVAAGGLLSTNTGAGRTVSVTGPVVVSAGLLESVAITVSVAVPDAVGVPEITQLVAVRPAGSAPARITQL
jgi:hypothetical protein